MHTENTRDASLVVPPQSKGNHKKSKKSVKEHVIEMSQMVDASSENGITTHIHTHTY